jgi:hypothetical protein
MRTKTIVVLVVLGALAREGGARVTFYDAFKTADYFQTSAAQPTEALNYRFDARLFTDVEGEAEAGFIFGPAGALQLTAVSPTFIAYRDDAGPESFEDLELAYPPGVYTYGVTGGTLAGESGSLSIGQPIYPDEVPYFDGPTFEAMAEMPEATAFPVTFNSFAKPPGADFAVTFFNVYDLTTNEHVYGTFGDAAAYTSDVVPASHMVRHHLLQFVVTFSNRYEGPGSFPQSTYISAFDLVTGAVGAVAPEWGLIYGDANDDRAVDAEDYALTDRGYAKGLNGWANGDYDLNGVIDWHDYLLMDESFASRGGALTAELLARREAEFGARYVDALVRAVPEPGAGVVCGLVAAVMCGLRRGSGWGRPRRW